MKVAIGKYLNLYTEVGHIDNSDLETDKLDIYILFYEYLGDELDMDTMEKRAKDAIIKWKDKHYVPKESPTDTKMRFIPEKITKVLEDEFMDEAAFVYIRYLL